jgi:hypothetical protein
MAAVEEWGGKKGIITERAVFQAD